MGISLGRENPTCQLTYASNSSTVVSTLYIAFKLSDISRGLWDPIYTKNQNTISWSWLVIAITSTEITQIDLVGQQFSVNNH